MLLGEFETKITDKFRLALPKKFRQEMGDRLVLARGYEGCVLVVAEHRWLELTRQVAEGSMFDQAVRQSTRFLFGGAFEVECDAQGRFVIPENLRQHAGLTIDATVVGLGRWVEIWSSQKWQEQVGELVKRGSELAGEIE